MIVPEKLARDRLRISGVEMINGDIRNEAIGGQLPHLAGEAALERDERCCKRDAAPGPRIGIHDLQCGTARSSQRD